MGVGGGGVYACRSLGAGLVKGFDLYVLHSFPEWILSGCQV